MADTVRIVVADRAVDPTAREEAPFRRRSAARCRLSSDERDFLRAAHRVPVEGAGRHRDLLGLGFTPHIRSRGEEAKDIRENGIKARRWVVERTLSWLNRFRRLRIRWEKKAENYLAMLHLAFAINCFRSAGLFG